MPTGIEKFLWKNFGKLPTPARVVAYFVVLFLFVYLTLVPRFIDGQLVFRDATSGGLIPYRGAQIQMQTAGRDYKFRSNESGYWSVPIISMLPGGMEVQIFHEDLAQWFPVKFATTHIWMPGSQRIEVTSVSPYVAIVDAGDYTNLINRALAGMNSWPEIFTRNAIAGLIVPGTSEQVTPPAETKKTEQAVVITVSKVIGKDPKEITMAYPLTGSTAPTYVQKIQIVSQLEKQYDLLIPDEHWKQMSTVRELVDYIQKRLTLNRKIETAYPKVDRPMLQKSSWPEIQRSLPKDERPTFKR